MENSTYRTDFCSPGMGAVAGQSIGETVAVGHNAYCRLGDRVAGGGSRSSVLCHHVQPPGTDLPESEK